MYACPAEDILNANEGIERGLDVGEVVFIPVHKKTITHIVIANESISSLSRLFSVPIDSIIKYNPNSEIQLKIGQKLSIKDAIIPKKCSIVPKGKYVYQFYDTNERKYTRKQLENNSIQFIRIT